MKILIIEDNAGIRNALLRGFKSRNVVVESVDDGKEGLKKIENHLYDVVIIDLILPNMSGEKIIEKMRQKGVETPILVLTSVKDVEIKTRLLNLGADDFIEKPFSFEELYARISAVLRRTAKHFTAESIKVGDLELIPEKRIAMRRKRKIALRGKEYSLLEYLMENKDTVVSRQTLMEKVWGYCTSVLSNTVDSHISALRRKIDKGEKLKLIKTIHGIGYMINAE